jgi:integrase
METQNKAYEIWERALKRRSPKVMQRHLLRAEGFLKYYNIPDLETLYQMRLEDTKSSDPRDSTRVEDMVKGYIQVLVDGGKVKPQTAIHFRDALASFFRANKLPLNIPKSDLPKGQSIGKRVITREQILQLLDNVGQEFRLRDRSIILLLKDSGVRLGDALRLDVGDYRNAENIKRDTGVFKVFYPKSTQKTKINAYPVIGEESIKALDTYLETRGQLSDEDPLFIDRDGKRMGNNGCTEMIRRSVKKMSGILLSAHSLRKFHTTMLEASGMQTTWIMKLQGKSLGRGIGPYSHPEESDQLTTAYIDGYDKLRVLNVVDLETQKKLMEQQKQIEGLTKWAGNLQTLVDLQQANLVKISKEKLDSGEWADLSKSTPEVYEPQDQPDEVEYQKRKLKEDR